MIFYDTTLAAWAPGDVRKKTFHIEEYNNNPKKIQKGYLNKAFNCQDKIEVKYK